MIPIYLCEDETPIREFLVREIEAALLVQNHDMAVVCQTADSRVLLKKLEESRERGVYFLDIDLGISGFTCFDLAKAIRRRDYREAIIFVTTHGELSMETFRYRLEAMDYILKDDMDAAAARVRECLDSVQRRMLRESAEKSEYYTVKVLDTIHNIPVSQILYFETSPQKHHILLHVQNQLVEFFGNLQTIEEEVGGGFFRCHHSALVNRDNIRAIHLKDNLVELENGALCPLSRKAKKALESE